MKVSNVPGDVLVTYALGSCLGVAIHDPVAQVGGLLHVMLPLSTLDPGKARQNPSIFLDTGLPGLFLSCYRHGARKERLVVKVAGGAGRSDVGDFFQIGQRNITALRRLLWKNGIVLAASDLGGTHPRTMSLEVGTGEVHLGTFPLWSRL